MLHKIPNEVIASILAATTAFIGNIVWGLPPWAIFIGWAGTYLAGGPHLPVMKKMWAAMPVGSTYALIIILLNTKWGTAFGTGWWGTTCFLAVTILVVNTALMYTGRVKVFALVPAMFFGFASMFATYFGGWGWKPSNQWAAIFAAWVVVIAMNFLGPIYAWVAEWLGTPRAVRKAAIATAAADSAQD